MKKTLAIAENNRKGNHKTGGLAPECGIAKAFYREPAPTGIGVRYALLTLPE
jgi:hypothetical protein